MTCDIPKTAARIQAELGVDLETALRFANAIGDTPEIDKDGLVVIRDLFTGKVTGEKLAIRFD